jgi:hypothetical protein
MARTVTLANLRTEVYERADVDDNYVPPDQMDRLINGSLAALYRMMARASKDWFLDSKDISVTPGGSPFALADDHWRAQKVLVQDGNDWYPMRRWSLSEAAALQDSGVTAASSGYRFQQQQLHVYPTDYTWSATIRVWYTPAPPVLDETSPGTSDVWDGVAGWEEWVILDCCLKLAVKQEEDTAALMAQRAEVWTDIMGDASEVDDAEPDRIRDVALETYGLDPIDLR